MTEHALVVGESLVDVVRRADGTVTEHPGGSAANVAVALARLGRPVRFLTALGDDPRGRLVVEHLTASGVVLAADPFVLSRTSTAAATLGDDGSATYDFDLTWRLDPDRLPTELPHVLHVCSVGAVLPPGADAVASLADRFHGRALVSYDVNVRAALTGTGPDVVGRVERLAALADVVKASDEDLLALWPSREVADPAAHLRSLGAAAVVVTRGASGADWYADGGPAHVPAPPTEVVDTVGAGDTFAAAVIDALWDGPATAPEDLLAHAVRAAAVTVSRAGADPPYRQELDG